MMLHAERRIGLHLLQDIQSAPAALPPGAVRGIGYDLQLAQHELRHQQVSFQEAGFDHVCNAAIDDGTGIEDFEIGLPCPRSPAKSSAKPPVKFRRSPLLAPTISPM